MRKTNQIRSKKNFNKLIETISSSQKNNICQFHYFIIQNQPL
jgi:hypothetical protein